MSSYKQLSDKEIKFIIDNYDKMTFNQIAESLNISKSKIHFQSKILKEKGLIGEKTKRYSWTQEEENILIELINNGKNIISLSKCLDKRVETVFGKINQFCKKGLINKEIKKQYHIEVTQYHKINYDKKYCSLERREWDTMEIKKLIDLVQKTGLTKVCVTLNRTTYDVIMTIYKLIENNTLQINDLYVKAGCKVYTEWIKEEDLFLINHFEKSKRENIMKQLYKFNWKQIYKRAKMFGLQRDSHRALLNHQMKEF